MTSAKRPGHNSLHDHRKHSSRIQHCAFLHQASHRMLGQLLTSESLHAVGRLTSNYKKCICYHWKQAFFVCIQTRPSCGHTWTWNTNRTNVLMFHAVADQQLISSCHPYELFYALNKPSIWMHIQTVWPRPLSKQFRLAYLQFTMRDFLMYIKLRNSLRFQAFLTWKRSGVSFCHQARKLAKSNVTAQ